MTIIIVVISIVILASAFVTVKTARNMMTTAANAERVNLEVACSEVGSTHTDHGGLSAMEGINADGEDEDKNP